VPSLDLSALKKKIAARRLAPVHLLVGEDVKLMDRMVDAIEGTIDEADRPFAVDRFYAGEPSAAPVDIVAAARALPMMGDRRLVLVLRAERVLKPKRGGQGGAEPEAEADGADDAAVDAAPLEEYLAAPVPSTSLVFVAADVDRTRRLTKRLVEAADVTTWAGFDAEGGRRDAQGEAAAWLRDELVRSGRTIEPEAARLLVRRAGQDITKLRGDVEKLELFIHGRSHITTDDVMEVAAEATAVDDEWGVVNAIANGDPARALAALDQRLDRGDSPHALVGQLRWWVSQRLAESDPGRVKAAVDALLRTDLALKRSGGDDRVLVERLVVELTGRPQPARRTWGGRR
jgi:DNA polymerase-3 subunit delta